MGMSTFGRSCVRRVVSRAGFAAALLSAVLAGCGGGGGGGGEDNSWLQFTPATLEATSYQGESMAVEVIAASSKTINEVVNVGVVDGAGVLTPGVTVVQVDATTYRATLHVAPTLAAGTYSGELTIRLCRDDPAVCANPYPGSPWQLPYRFVVQPGTNLSPLSALTGASAWSTYQGNAAHTGFVPATVSVGQFSRRWAWQQASTAVVAEGGRVITVRSDAANHWWLSALRESDGSVAWSYDMGALSHVNPPAISAGKVYVTSTGHSDTFMWAFDAATGALLAKRPMSSQWEAYLAPTVYQGAVYTESGGYGGLMKFDAASVTEQWWSQLDQYDTWTPAVDAQYAYTLAGSMFTATNVSDGSPAFQIEDTGFDWHGYSMHGAPVLDGAGRAFASSMGGRLLGFSLSGRTLAWTLTDQFASDPALANGVLYVVNGPSLEARSAATGALQWSWMIPDPASYATGVRSQVIVTSTLAFVRGESHTYAVDLTSHDSTWNYPAAGPMALSRNGVLYIADPAGRLVAVNLH